MTLAHLRILMASAACVALTAPAWAQDEDAAETEAVETAAEEALGEDGEPLEPEIPPAYVEYAFAPLEPISTYAPSTGFAIISMSEAEMGQEIAAASAALEGCENRLEALSTALETLPADVSVSIAPPAGPPEPEAEETADGEADGEDAAALLPPGVLPPGAEPPAEEEDEDEAEAEETAEAEDADGDAEADGENGETADGEDGEAEEEDTGPIIDGVFAIHADWSYGLVQCAIRVDATAGQIEGELARRGRAGALPALDALNERVSAFDDTVRAIAPSDFVLAAQLNEIAVAAAEEEAARLAAEAAALEAESAALEAEGGEEPVEDAPLDDAPAVEDAPEPPAAPAAPEAPAVAAPELGDVAVETPAGDAPDGEE